MLVDWRWRCCPCAQRHEYKLEKFNIKLYEEFIRLSGFLSMMVFFDTILPLGSLNRNILLERWEKKTETATKQPSFQHFSVFCVIAFLILLESAVFRRNEKNKQGKLCNIVQPPRRNDSPASYFVDLSLGKSKYSNFHTRDDQLHFWISLQETKVTKRHRMTKRCDENRISSRNQNF